MSAKPAIANFACGVLRTNPAEECELGLIRTAVRLEASERLLL